ncbi:MAG: hypothetical protein K2Q01_00915 [Rickettsiales bacterium]|nr:hypothetical protein [Rickettsiales bacterium]
MKPLIIFGDAELAELACFYFELTGHAVVGFCVDGAYLTRSTVLGKPVYAFEEAATRFPPATHELFVAIGFSAVNVIRRDKYHQVKALGYTLPTCISPMAAVRTKDVGDNCLIPDMNNIHPYTRIGNNVIFSNANHVGHHSVIEDHCFISAGVVLCGGVTIGEGTFMAVRSSVRERVMVGRHNVIGVGVDIYADTQDNAVYSLPHVKPRDTLSHDMAKL